MSDYDTRLRETAEALEHAAAEFASVIQSEPAFRSRSLTAVIDGSTWADVTLYESASGPASRTCKLTGFDPVIWEPAWLLLAFRMGMLRATQVDTNVLGFTNMPPELLADLHTLARYVISQYNADTGFTVSAEWSTNKSGLIAYMLHTSSHTGFVYRTNISRMSRALLSDDAHFILFDSENCGAVLIM